MVAIQCGAMVPPEMYVLYCKLVITYLNYIAIFN